MIGFGILNIRQTSLWWLQCSDGMLGFAPTSWKSSSWFIAWRGSKSSLFWRLITLIFIILCYCICSSRGSWSSDAKWIFERSKIGGIYGFIGDVQKHTFRVNEGTKTHFDSPNAQTFRDPNTHLFISVRAVVGKEEKACSSLARFWRQIGTQRQMSFSIYEFY